LYIGCSLCLVSVTPQETLKLELGFMLQRTKLS
jgi:hypothetical protein